jgi:hypothetical protein
MAPVFTSSAEIFAKICLTSNFENFYGLRDYYSFVKQFNALPMSGSARASRITYAMEREFGMALSSNPAYLLN